MLRAAGFHLKYDLKHDLDLVHQAPQLEPRAADRESPNGLSPNGLRCGPPAGPGCEHAPAPDASTRRTDIVSRA